MEEVAESRRQRWKHCQRKESGCCDAGSGKRLVGQSAALCERIVEVEVVAGMVNKLKRKLCVMSRRRRWRRRVVPWLFW